MSAQNRGTRRGKPSPQPSGGYEAPPAVEHRPGATVVAFQGRDGRSRDFDFASLALPEMAADLAAAFAVRTGHTGALNTLTSATNTWNTVRTLLKFLAKVPHAPGGVEAITPPHLRRYRADRLAGTDDVIVNAEMRRICRLLDEVPADRLRADTRAFLRSRQYVTGRTGHEGVPGYDDEVFAAIMRAARADVAGIRDRIRASERLLAAAEAGTLSADQREEADGLAAMAASGEVPPLLGPGCVNPNAARRLAYASRLFVTSQDLAPLVVLGIGVSGRNGETVKELPAEHVLHDGKAVQIQAIKRRRGAGHWFSEVVWEIGEPSRALHTPGGFYLLLLELTARSRAVSGSRSAWSVWLGGSVAEMLHGGRHVDPFAAVLSRDLGLPRWAARHGLTENGAPLRLTANRLKTTVERRHTAAVGGHLPSAVRTNTQDVLFASYLSGDATVRDWADGLIAESVADAEAAARAAHARALEPVGGRVPVAPATEATRAQATAFASCTAIDDSPFNDGTCRASFLACFACRNAVVTTDHLPALLDLRAQAEARWGQIPTELWWRRYGQAWLAITEDVLPAFTPAQIAQAEPDTPSEAGSGAGRLLDLLEGPRET